MAGGRGGDLGEAESATGVAIAAGIAGRSLREKQHISGLSSRTTARSVNLLYVCYDLHRGRHNAFLKGSGRDTEDIASFSTEVSRNVASIIGFWGANGSPDRVSAMLLAETDL